jgi:nitrate reductase beta subunit
MRGDAESHGKATEPCPKSRTGSSGARWNTPYEESRPKRQWAIVFDLNKCIACQTCTSGLQDDLDQRQGPGVHVLEQRRDQALRLVPAGLGRALLEKLGRRTGRRRARTQGKTIFEAAEPVERASTSPPGRGLDVPQRRRGRLRRLIKSTAGHHIGELPHDKWFFYLPRTCAHCTYPACLAACPRKAIYKREEDGIVLIDQARCKGYGECVRACPYKKSMYNPHTRTSEKCVGCYPKVEQGTQPQCVVNCIGKIRVMGFINPPEGQPGQPVDYLVHEADRAPLLPAARPRAEHLLHPAHPRRPRVPRQMFGPQVDGAIERYKKLKDDPVAQGLFVLFGCTDKIMHRFTVDKRRGGRLRRRGA